MEKKYVDIPATLQVIGNIYNNPQLLDQEDKYFFHESDFINEFHKILFGSIYNLHQLGASEITPTIIEDYLAEKPTKLAVYKANQGAEYLIKLKENASLASFNYYYNRIKKMTLLREYSKAGVDLSWLYDANNLTDIKKKQNQEDWLDRTELEEIADLIDDKLQRVRETYINDTSSQSCALGEGIHELFTRLEETPDVGVPLYGAYINAIHRGARLGKFYLRSAPTNTGKTRSMMADALFISCSRMWDMHNNCWIELTTKEPVLFISTEGQIEELQTMAVAFIAGVSEDRILKGALGFEEIERVQIALDVINQAPIFIEHLPDYNLKDIEDTIKRNIRERKSRYIFLDYIHTSIKILEEITRRSGGVKLREDNILFMISVKLKDIADQFKVFIMSATQLNEAWKTSKTPDQNLLRGAKAIADKTDFACILLETTQEDLESLRSILSKTGLEVPDLKCSIYKNRGPHKGIYLWMKAHRGACRYDPIFATRWDYELIDIEDIKITVQPEGK